MGTIEVMHTTTASRIWIATLSLVAAIAVYCLARSQPPALLEPIRMTIPALAGQAELFANLPSLFYTLALGLLIGCCAKSNTAARWHCMLWLAIALLLELGQHRLVAVPVSSWLHGRVSESTWQVIGPYWTGGSFDTLDLLATLAGGIVALMFFVVAHRDDRNELISS